MADGISIEQLRDPEDIEVRHLLVELALEEQDKYNHPKESRAEITARTGAVEPRFVGENLIYIARAASDRAVGLIWCALFDPGTGLEGEIAELYVENDARGQGVASALIERAMRLFRDRQVTFVSVWTRDDNPAALRAYEKAGFKPTEQTVLTWLPLPESQ